MENITLREAVRRDAPRIAALIAMGASAEPMNAQDAAIEGARPEYLAAFDDLAAIPNNGLFVAEHHAPGDVPRVIGTYQVTIIPGIAKRGRRRAKIESVHVDPAYRGQGVGRMMIAAAIEHARAHGVGIVELTSQKSRVDAHRFYRGLGFAQIHEGFKLMLE
jgi:ribosomal protein S18 acetylase RimI-like enzyme